MVSLLDGAQNSIIFTFRQRNLLLTHILYLAGLQIHDTMAPRIAQFGYSSLERITIAGEQNRRLK